MPIDFETERALATVDTISDIQPIQDADKIEVATVRGWQVVVRKGEFQPGDQIIYFEVDTALPVDDPRFSFLEDRGTRLWENRKYHILKTIRLRGVYSQGLIQPLSDWFLLGAPEETNVTKKLGLGKYEKPLPGQPGMGKNPGAHAKGPFLTEYAPKTDSERVQNLGKYWKSIQNLDWVITSKIDGTSVTYIRDLDGEIRVCSRNWELHFNEDSIYWSVLKEYPELADTLQPGEAIQAELAGPGIQGNPLHLSKVRPFVFSYLRNKKYNGFHHFPEPLWKLKVPLFFLDRQRLSEYTIPELIEEINGMESLVSPDRLEEGVVFHTLRGDIVPFLGRNTFKVISNKYLLKH